MQLYQKYRPTILDEVIGHPKVIKELKKRLSKNEIPQSIYATGDSGVGKSTLAYILAKSILCQNLQNSNPCNTCEYCNDVNSENFSLGAHYYNCSNVNIDVMRSIEEQSLMHSMMSDKKIFILDELQELSKNPAARKNLLNALEKPKKDVYFILLSMSDEKIDVAVKNRSVVYKLNSLQFDEVADLLNSICQKEGVHVDEEKAKTLIAIAENSDGSPRTAISYLERCIYGDIWKSDEILKELGIASKDELIDFAIKMLSGNASILEEEITEDMIQKLKFIIGLAYGAKLGQKLNYWQQSQIGNLIRFDKQKLRDNLQILNELRTYVWVSKDLIYFTIMKCISLSHQE